MIPAGSSSPTPAPNLTEVRIVRVERPVELKDNGNKSVVAVCVGRVPSLRRCCVRWDRTPTVGPRFTRSRDAENGTGSLPHDGVNPEHAGSFVSVDRVEEVERVPN